MLTLFFPLSLILLTPRFISYPLNSFPQRGMKNWEVWGIHRISSSDAGEKYICSHLFTETRNNRNETRELVSFNCLCLQMKVGRCREGKTFCTKLLKAASDAWMGWGVGKATRYRGAYFFCQSLLWTTVWSADIQNVRSKVTRRRFALKGSLANSSVGKITARSGDQLHISPKRGHAAPEERTQICTKLCTC